MMAKTPKADRKRAPQSDDALRLAALRWYAITIERISIEVFATHPEKYEQLEGKLKDACKALQGLGGQKKKLKGPDEDEQDGCPDGYKLCPDGLCAPMCGV